MDLLKECIVEAANNFPHVFLTGACHGTSEYVLPALCFGFVNGFVWFLVCFDLLLLVTFDGIL